VSKLAGGCALSPVGAHRQSESGAQQSSPQQQFQTHITVVRVIDDPTKARRGGWVFGGEDPDPVWGAQDLWEVSEAAGLGGQGADGVCVLWVEMGTPARQMDQSNRVTCQSLMMCMHVCRVRWLLFPPSRSQSYLYHSRITDVCGMQRLAG
jgi:hypothetical protein